MVAMRLGLGCIALVLLACTTPIQIEHASRGGVEIAKLALVPLREASRVRAAASPEDENRASLLVTARLLDALIAHRTFEVVSPAEVATALGGDSASWQADRARTSALLQRTFGVQAILLGTVERFDQREGGERGVTRPAAVRVRLELRSGSGEVVWRALYDEVQKSLSADPRSLRRVREREFRWVTAEELTRYGARELVLAIPGASETFK